MSSPSTVRQVPHYQASIDIILEHPDRDNDDCLLVFLLTTLSDSEATQLREALAVSSEIVDDSTTKSFVLSSWNSTTPGTLLDMLQIAKISEQRGGTYSLQTVFVDEQSKQENFESVLVADVVTDVRNNSMSKGIEYGRIDTEEVSVAVNNIWVSNSNLSDYTGETRFLKWDLLDSKIVPNNGGTKLTDPTDVNWSEDRLDEELERDDYGAQAEAEKAAIAKQAIRKERVGMMHDDMKIFCLSTFDEDNLLEMKTAMEDGAKDHYKGKLELVNWGEDEPGTLQDVLGIVQTEDKPIICLDEASLAGDQRTVLLTDIKHNKSGSRVLEWGRYAVKGSISVWQGLFLGDGNLVAYSEGVKHGSFEDIEAGDVDFEVGKAASIEELMSYEDYCNLINIGVMNAQPVFMLADLELEELQELQSELLESPTAQDEDGEEEAKEFLFVEWPKQRDGSLQDVARIAKDEGQNPMIFLDRQSVEDRSVLLVTEHKEDGEDEAVGVNVARVDISQVMEAYHDLKAGTSELDAWTAGESVQIVRWESKDGNDTDDGEAEEEDNVDDLSDEEA